MVAPGPAGEGAAVAMMCRMTDESPRAVLATVLARTGLAFPRGVLGDETRRLAQILNGDDAGGEDLDDLVTRAAAGLWPELQPSTQAALERYVSQSEPGEEEPLLRALAWARHESADENPLARALVVRAAQELAAALGRGARILEHAEPAIAAGDAQGAVAAAEAAGAAVVELLDLDPEDFAAEIYEYVENDESAEALDTLARSTGDEETRAWAREALSDLAGDATGTAAGTAMAALTDGDPPPDPADDAVWVPTVLALVQLGFERALTAE